MSGNNYLLENILDGGFGNFSWCYEKLDK